MKNTRFRKDGHRSHALPMPTLRTLRTCVLLLASCTWAACTQPDTRDPGNGGGTAGNAEPSPKTVDLVGIKGNQKIDTGELLGRIKLRKGDVLAAPSQIKSDIDAVVTAYRERGLDISIMPDVRHPAEGHVEVFYLIDEQGTGGDAGPAPPPK